MRLAHYQLTLTGVAQQLSSALPGTEDESIENVGIREVHLQADDGNSNPIFIGGDENVTTAAYGERINAPTGGVPDAAVNFGPYADAGPIKLSGIWVIGTNGEILNLLAVEF